MKFSVATIMALAIAAPALAQRGGRGGGATRGGRGGNTGSTGGAAAASGAVCRLSSSVIPASTAEAETGGPIPANLDGVRISATACNSVGGQLIQGCCIKNDCAGAGTPSACLVPSLSGDSPPGAGRFVGGTCPTGLRCFELNQQP